MKNIHKSNVHVKNSAFSTDFDMVQFDTGNVLELTIKDMIIPEGTTAKAFFLKPSGKFVYKEAGVTINGNVITCPVDNQAISEVGLTKYQVKLYSGTDIISTFGGSLHVKPSYQDSSAEKSETIITAFEQAVIDGEERIEAAKNSAVEEVGKVIDPTLTQKDKAADSKATGDALQGLESRLSESIAEISDAFESDFYGLCKVIKGKTITYASGVCSLTDDTTGKVVLLPVDALAENKIAIVKWNNNRSVSSGNRVMMLDENLESLNNGTALQELSALKVHNWKVGSYPALEYIAIPFDSDITPDFILISLFPLKKEIDSGVYNDVTEWSENQLRESKYGFYVSSIDIVSGTRYASNVIDVSGKSKGFTNAGTVFVFYMDSNFTKVGNANITTHSFNIPSNAVYMIMFSDTPYSDTDYLYLGKDKGVYIEPRVIKSEYAKGFANNDWIGKKWCSYGDSITECTANLKGWQNWVTDYFGFSVHYQRGKGGSEISYVNDSESNKMTYNGHTFFRYGCMWERITNMIPQDSDLVYVMFGTNDMSRSMNTLDDPVWAASNTLDGAWIDYCTANGLAVGDFNLLSYKGAICSTIVKIHEWCPTAVIVFGTPYSGRGDAAGVAYTEQWKNAKGYTTEDYAKACIDACHYMSVPVIDVNGNTGVNVFNRAEYLKDQVHPSDTVGRMMIARAVIGGLKGIIPMLNPNAYD